MIYLILSLALVAIFLLIYFKSDRFKDRNFLIKSILVISIAIFFTYISKVIFIHKPIFIVHLALVFISWHGALNFIRKNQFSYFLIFAPAVTTVLFFILAIFFRDHA